MKGPSMATEKPLKKEVAKIIDEAARLKEILTGRLAHSEARDQAVELYHSLGSSKSEAWSDNPTNEARMDFLKRCGIALHNEKNTREEDEQNLKELDETWGLLNRFLLKSESH